ncbi:MAG: aminotransferase class IV [Burkholderiaceae bacterium]
MWQPTLILVNGERIPFAQAGLHPLSLGVAYATTVFEGIRAYRDPGTGGFWFFRLHEHLRRLDYGMKLMRMDRRLDADSLRDELAGLIHANAPDDDVYIRLLVYVEAIGLLATTGPVGYTAAAMPRERSRLVETGMSLGVSSWRRLSDEASPPRIKATANYHNARLAHLQAKADGYDGALMLTTAGKVSETPIACFFMVRDGELITPDTGSGVLESITRDTVLTLHGELAGCPGRERPIDRSELHLADEAFICGTGQEIIPVTSIDRLPVGDGVIGPVTRALMTRYTEVVRGLTDDHAEWRTAV